MGYKRTPKNSKTTVPRRTYFISPLNNQIIFFCKSRVCVRQKSYFISNTTEKEAVESQNNPDYSLFLLSVINLFIQMFWPLPPIIDKANILQ